jgi:hypothetical protein
MKSSVVKRSVVVAGRKTSVSLEDAFWKTFNKVAEADLASIALEARAQPCVSPETLNARTTNKPTGCSAAGSDHGLVNQLKRTFHHRERQPR